ncbi:MAG: sulfatase-like hydrolase/transferase, partial [Planctomycetes bacterium]|nr:sulfatase-like hydrolase/transferase [Planctomycetota bacterium]
MALTVSSESPAGREDLATPSILVIVVDDLGWNDLGVTGSSFYETPSIDGWAANSVRFSRAYAACPVCSPT